MTGLFITTVVRTSNPTNSQNSMNVKDSLPCSQKLITNPYPYHDELSPYPPITGRSDFPEIRYTLLFGTRYMVQLEKPTY
jgi:hypothetical protein